jgi:ABC-2 type transport system permease protein
VFLAALIIAWTDLRRVVRERQSLFWLFVAPLIFAVFFGVLLRPQQPRPTVVSIVDEDRPAPLAGELATMLSADGVRTRMVASAPASGFALVVPKGTAEALAADKPIQLVLKAGAEQTDAERRLHFKIQKALVNLTLQGPTPSPVQDTKGPLALAQASLDVRRQGTTYGFQRAIPAYLVMFVFLNLLVSGAGIAEERATGQMRRLVLTPASFNHILLGKLLSRFATGWLQIAYLLALGIFVFGIEWGAHPGVLCAFLSVFALASAALGILVGTLFADPDKCATLAVWSAMILSPLGGLWWPLEIVGPTLRKVAYFVPTGWGMEAVNSIMAFGAGALDVAPFAAALAGLFVVSFVLAARRLRRLVIA